MTTYSTNLGLTLIGTGEQAGTWGDTTNTNLGTLLEQSISGYVTQTVTDGAATVLTIPDGTSGVARNMYIELTGTLTAARVVEVPAKKKLYYIYNNTSGGFAVTVKVNGQTGISVSNGKKVVLVCDGTDVYNAVNDINGTVTNATNATNAVNLVTTNYTVAQSGSNLLVSHGATSLLSITSVGVTTLNPAVASSYNGPYFNVNMADGGVQWPTYNGAPASLQKGAAVGSGSWNNVGSSPGRALGTTYTNSYAHPIAVAASVTCSAQTGDIRIVMNTNGVTIFTNGSYVTGGTPIIGGFLIVGPGQTYSVNNTGSTVTATLNSWWEMY